MKRLKARLRPKAARMAVGLREAGIPISRAVPDALHAAHERYAARRVSCRRPSQLMAEIYREFPDPEDRATGKRDLTDRSRVRRTIRQHLRRRPS